MKLSIGRQAGMGGMVSVAAFSSSATQRSNGCYAQNQERVQAEITEALTRVWGGRAKARPCTAMPSFNVETVAASFAPAPSSAPPLGMQGWAGLGRAGQVRARLF